MNSFREDKLAAEKNDPIEGSSARLINVPLTLLAVFFGFGVTYLALRTDRVTMQEGDSRTHVSATAIPEAATSNDAATAGSAAAPDAAALLEHGKQIFTTTCQACHQAGGTGIAGTFPPLVGSEWVTGPASRTVAIVLNGINGEIVVKGEKYHSVMPTFKDQFQPEDIAAVVTYVRQTFGKTTDVVAPSLVEKIKKEIQAKSAPWSGGTELNSQKWE
jgi:mono/diheme cytochrome c family protein